MLQIIGAIPIFLIGLLVISRQKKLFDGMDEDHFARMTKAPLFKKFCKNENIAMEEMTLAGFEPYTTGYIKYSQKLHKILLAVAIVLYLIVSSLFYAGI